MLLYALYQNNVASIYGSILSKKYRFHKTIKIYFGDSIPMVQTVQNTMKIANMWNTMNLHNIMATKDNQKSLGDNMMHIQCFLSRQEMLRKSRTNCNRKVLQNHGTARVSNGAVNTFILISVEFEKEKVVLDSANHGTKKYPKLYLRLYQQQLRASSNACR